MNLTQKQREAVNAAKRALLTQVAAGIQVREWLDPTTITIALGAELPDAVIVWYDFSQSLAYEKAARLAGVDVVFAHVSDWRRLREFEHAVFAPDVPPVPPMPGVRCVRVIRDQPPEPLNFAQRMRVYRLVMQPMIDAGMLSVRWAVPHGKSQAEGKHHYYPGRVAE